MSEHLFSSSSSLHSSAESRGHFATTEAGLYDDNLGLSAWTSAVLFTGSQGPSALAPEKTAACEKASSESPDTISTRPSQSVSPVALDSAAETFSDFTIASPDIAKRMDKIFRRVHLRKPATYLDIPAIWTKSYWETGDKDAKFLRYNWGRRDNFIYVRPCYLDIYKILHKGWQGLKPYSPTLQRQRCAYITGTPGIGKSVFGLFLCKVLCGRSKPALIFYGASRPANFVHVFWQGSIHQIEETSAEKLISLILKKNLYSYDSDKNDLIEIWAIGDTCLCLPDALINRVCISSPGQTRRVSTLGRDLKSWVKEKSALQLVIPPCDWNEILNIRCALVASDPDQKCPLDALQERFNLWGGVPRTIIINPELLRNRESEELKKIRVKDAMQFLGTYDLDHDHLSGKLFHLHPAFLKSYEDNPSLMDKYDAGNAKYFWATKALEARAWAQFGRQQEEEVLDFILTKANDPAARGNAWEPYIHLLIESEGLTGTL